jgi:DNA mismatch repair protein MutS
MEHATCMAMDASAGRHGDVFTFMVSVGRAGQSYGLRTAAIAGLPTSVLARAEALLAGYEEARPADPLREGAVPP